MGLIKAAVGAIGSTLKDQWKEAIRCEDLGNDILMKKKTTDTGVITNKSTIIVGPGQCAVIYDNGRVIDATAEEGFYTFDDSSSPSFFAGQFGAVFKEMWQRFTYNGASAKEQAVYFFNTKEIINNNYGTGSLVSFTDWQHSYFNQIKGEETPLSVYLKSHGKYTFKISNPALFMQTIAGTADVYKKDQLTEQIRADVLEAFQNVLNELGNSNHKIPVLELPSQTDEIKQVLAEAVFDEPLRGRGLEITGFAVEGIILDDDSKKKIDDYEISANSFMQQGKLVGAYADAVKDAANNSNGAANGFMGIGMMNMASGGVMGGAVQGPWQNATPVQQQTNVANNNIGSEPTENKNVANQATTQDVAQASNSTWTCACGTVNTGKFCNECGAKRPEADTEKKCPKCGAINPSNSKFCNECGEKL